MGRFGEVVSAANASSAPCSLGGYPFVSAPGVGAPGSVAALDSFSDAAGVPAAAAPRPARLELRPGRVASAVLGGPDRPPDRGPVCRTFHAYEVGLPDSSTATAVHGELADCAGLFVGPFVLGFSGTAPSGDVVGTAPACRGAESSASGPAPFVQVEAWTGSVLAGATSVFASPGAPALLSPGPEPRSLPDHLRAPAVPLGDRPRRVPRRPRALRRVLGDGGHADDHRWIRPASGNDEHDRPALVAVPSPRSVSGGAGAGRSRATGSYGSDRISRSGGGRWRTRTASGRARPGSRTTRRVP